MEQISTRVNRKFPCRTAVIQTLVELIGDSRETFPSCVYIYGNTGTGKTTLLKYILKQAPNHSNIRSAFINSIECYTRKILLEQIINKIRPQWRRVAGEYFSCDTIKDFINETAQWSMGENADDVGYVIVVDNAERMRDMDANILPTFLRLPELTGLNICSVLISQLPFEKFYSKTGLSEVIVVHFPQYTKHDILEILTTDFQKLLQNIRCQQSERAPNTLETRLKILDNISIEFFSNYLNIFLHVFYKACRDLPELKLTSTNCFNIYLEPVLDGSIEYNDVTRLWRHISGPLRVALSQVCLNINIPTDGLHRVPNNAQIHPPLPDQSVKQLAQSLELPYYGKYLLISAFLASHNSAKDDKRLFVKHHGKQRKRLQQVNAKAKMSEKMSISLGPKPFSIDRLLAIFFAILDEKVSLTCNLLSQVSTLVHLKLLSFVSGENNIMDGSSRLQCTVGLEFILHIGRIVGFNVRQYLIDFI